MRKERRYMYAKMFHKFVLTSIGESKTRIRNKYNGEMSELYERRVPTLWIQKGYVMEVKDTSFHMPRFNKAGIIKLVMMISAVIGVFLIIGAIGSDDYATIANTQDVYSAKTAIICALIGVLLMLPIIIATIVGYDIMGDE